MIKTLFIFAVLGFMFVVAAISASAQSQDWRSYSPPDKSFSVRLSFPLVKVKSFDGEHGVDYEPELVKMGVRSYASIEGDDARARFGIIVVSQKVLGNWLSVGANTRKVKDILAVTFFADDDESQCLSAPKMILSDGVKGEEYVLVNNDKADDGRRTRYTKGRIFNRKNKTFLIVYIGKNEKDLSSDEAKMFFSSFRIRNSFNKSRKSPINTVTPQ